jgi:putative transposase
MGSNLLRKRRIAPNVLDRDFKASLPNENWVTDVSHVTIKNEKIYFSFLICLMEKSLLIASRKDQICR